MSNILYPKAKESLLSAGINLLTDNIKAVLVDTTVGSNPYTLDSANHEFLSDVPANSRISTTANFTGKTVLNGVFDADDTQFPSVPAGDAAEAYVIYQDTGVEATSRLIAYIDTATGLAVSPDGNNINVTFDSGVNKIFAL
jgi:hypothetical protein